MKRGHSKKISILILLVTAMLSMPVIAEEMVDTKGIETLRKTGKAFSAVAKQATPAVVAVQVRSRVRVSQSDSFGSPFDEDFFERFFGRPMPRQRERQPRERWREGQASGFIVSPDGYVMTNAHVISGADEITIILNDGREFDEVDIIGVDEQADVALVKIKDTNNLPTVELGDSDSLEIGEWVVAIGNPFGLTETLTVGVVSALGRKLGGRNVYQDFIQTDAAINPGNSGGPLLNLEGKVVGMNSAIITGMDQGYMGIGLAIPINMAKNIQQQLIETGTVKRGFAGITMQDISSDMTDFFELESTDGAIVTSVIEDSPAEQAGLQKDDVIIQIDDKQISDTQDVRNIIGFTSPGTDVEITVIRDGREKKVVMKVGSQDESETATTSSIGQQLGLTVQTINQDVADQYGVREGEGVIISAIEPDSAAENAQLQEGMVILEVNGKEVNNVGQFNQALKESRSGRAYLFIKVDSTRYYVTLPIEE